MKHTTKIRLIMLAGVVVFLITFQWIYSTLVAENWSYMSFTYVTPSFGFFVVTWVASLAPALWMPIELKRPSQLLYWLLYLTVYIPSVTVPYYRHTQTTIELLTVTGCMLLGFLIVSLSYRIPVLKVPRIELRQESHFWWLLALLTIASLALYLAAYGSNLRLVGFQDIYEVRMAARRIETDIITDYTLFYLAYTIFPLLMILGLIRKNIFFLAIGIGGEVLLYAGVAARAWMLSVFYVPFLYFVVRKYRHKIGLALVWTTCAQFVLILLLQFIDLDGARRLSDLIVIRNHANSGLLTGLYSEFFSTHPLTYGSHLKGLNMVITYPYSMGVPFLIGDYLHVNFYFDISANGHLWATDGIASLGSAGIVIISLFLAFVFLVLDSYSSDLEPWVGALLVAMQFFNLSNNGLFASLLGGGLGLAILLVAIMPRSIVKPKYSKLDLAALQEAAT
jgi:hypothetical protein